MRLKGKVAVITGGASGLGAAIVQRFAQEGARVLAVDIQGDRQIEIHGDNPAVQCMAADVADPDAARAIVKEAHQAFGSIDILVNNAGIEGSAALMVEQTDADWQHVQNVNLGSVYRLCRDAAPVLAESGAGRIINMSSIVGGVSAVPGTGAYAAAKAGILGLSRVLALELGSQKITVNCILPGLIDTPLNAKRGKERLEEAVSRIPVGRLGTASDIAGLALFLASDEAAYISGQGIQVDGGWTIRL